MEINRKSCSKFSIRAKIRRCLSDTLPHVRDVSREGVCVVSECGNYLDFTLAFAFTKIFVRSLFVDDIKKKDGF